jgi:hypothetical protein
MSSRQLLRACFCLLVCFDPKRCSKKVNYVDENFFGDSVERRETEGYYKFYYGFTGNDEDLRTGLKGGRTGSNVTL